jgi:hypothetical protein
LLTLEEKIFRAIYVVGLVSEWSGYSFELFKTGAQDPIQWEELARSHYRIDVTSSDVFIHRVQITVMNLIKENMNLALTSPSPYIRTYAQLIYQETR